MVGLCGGTGCPLRRLLVMDPPNHWFWAEEKFGNFKSAYGDELVACGFTAQQVHALKWSDLARYLTLARVLVQPAVEARDVDALFAMLELVPECEPELVKTVWGALSEERQDKVWRYFNLFFRVLDTRAQNAGRPQ